MLALEPAHHLLPSSAEVKNGGAIPYLNSEMAKVK
jgi:hypothetical protein